jgi:hypothetical protein
MSEKIVYTALFGPYEELKEPLVITPGWKYICFTDQEVKSDAWKIEGTLVNNNNYQSQARFAKILFPYIYTEFKQLLWLDASFQINCNLDDFWNKHYKGGITAPRHPARACVYREGQICMRRDLDGKRVEKQVNRYANEGMPAHGGLISSGILMRDNSDPVKEFCDLWWKQIENGSLRDQIGFAYADWKLPGVAHTFNYDYRVRQEFIYTKHFHNR